ncbi:MAG: outer membrane beta-barrel protein [Mucilaginibacter sp.]|uniref:outer membrane beta-barrel protein n=1 Tax=Mucilaginibacter sp. TaxID=1882438 RepID=UPI003265D263
MNKNYLLLYLLVFLSFSTVLAQSNNGTISGKITDPLTGETIDFASVSVLTPGTEDIVKSNNSNNGGLFKISNLTYGKYTLRITNMGYEKYIAEDIEVDGSHVDVYLGTIKLKKSGGSLNEVAIVEKKNTVEFGADQINYNVSSSLQSEGSTATDVLKNVPMVSVDIDGNATIAGKRNTRVFIDGKPSDYMTSNITDLLNVLPSDAIEKIEVMTNPPAKYSADGEGIINIVLKKGYKVGLNGTLSLSAGTLGNYNVNTYASYKGKGLSLTSSYAFGRSESNTYSTSMSQNFLADTNYNRNQFANRNSMNFGHNLRESINWDIDTTRNLRLTGNFNFNKAQGGSGSDYLYFDENDIETQLRDQNNNNHNQSVNYVFDADYTWKRTNGDQLEAAATYSANQSNNDRFAQTLYLDASGLPIANSKPLNQTYAIDGKNRAFQFKLDYDKPLFEAKKSTFNIGVSANMRKHDNDQDVQDYSFTNQLYNQNTLLSSQFTYNEHIYAGYASLTIKTENKWSFRMGGRSELTDVNFNLGDNAADAYSIKPYISFFPNVSAAKNFSNYTVGISYSGRIGRPNEYALNPQVIYNTNNPNIAFGNTDLIPSYTQQLDLTFSIYGKNWAFYPRIGVANTSHIIERLTTPINSGAYQTTYNNLGSSSYNTVNLYGNYRVSRKINLNGGGTFGHMVYESQSDARRNRNGYTIQSKAGAQIDLPGKTAFEGNFNYYSNSSAQGRNKGSLTSSFAMRKAFYKNKMRVRIMAVNPLGQTSSTTLTNDVTFNKQDYYTINSRNYTISVSYNFTKVGNKAVKKII